MPSGWDTAGFDDSSWDAVAVVDHGYRRSGRFAGPAGAPRRGDRPGLGDAARRATGRSSTSGRTSTAGCGLPNLGPAGTTITLTHGEWLGPDGDVTTDHLRPDVPFLPHPLPAGQVDIVVSAGVPGEVFEPRHTTHGFQYVRIEGHPDDLTPDDVRGVVVHTDMRRTGWFSCSDERVDRLHEAAVWSLRDNACDVPTDCPHRERAGWTATGSCSSRPPRSSTTSPGSPPSGCATSPPTSGPTARSPTSAPAPAGEGREGPVAFLNGSAGWGDAVVIVPWELYRAYGDAAILEELWPTMVALAGPRRADGPRPSGTRRGSARRPEPAPHEKYLWDSRLPLGGVAGAGRRSGADFGAFVAADKGDVATAYFAHSAGLMARIARVARPGRDAARYAELADHVRAAWQAEYVGADGSLTPDTQANHVRALAFDLVPAELRPAVADRLVELIRTADTHLGHRLPRHAVPAAGAGRHRAPRRRLRAAAPGHRAVLAGDDRPRRDHRVGALERRQRRRRAARVAQPLLQGRRHLVPAPVHRRDRAAR